MSQKAPEPTLNSLVAEAAALRARKEAIEEELAKVSAKIVELGAGKYCDAIGNVCQVIPASGGIQAAPSYALPADREAIARQLAQDNFGKLFDRVVSYTPCSGFADVAPKILTPARARDIVALCFVPGKITPKKAAHLRWEK